MKRKAEHGLLVGLVALVLLLGLVSITLYIARQSLSTYQNQLLRTNQAGIYFQPTSVSPDISFPFIRMNGKVHSYALLQPVMEVTGGVIYVNEDELLLEQWVPVRVSTYTTNVVIHKHGERDVQSPDQMSREQQMFREPGEPRLYKAEADKDSAPAMQLRPECVRMGFCRR